MKISLNIQSELKEWNQPIVMGILNLTPDSFYDGGRYNTEKDVLFQVEKMLNDGADIIDMGAFSSRPGASLISEEEEQQRLIPALEFIRREFEDTILSIDTYRSSIARQCLDLGAGIINDISGGTIDKKLIQVVAEYNVPYILMHMQSKPKDMQKSPSYNDVSREIYQWLGGKIEEVTRAGIKDVIIDPGFGFGKDLDHNYQLLKDLSYFQQLGKPILVGLSRKKMIQQLIEREADDALNGTTAAHTIALLNGASILRVHDVLEAKEAIRIVDFYQKQ